MLLASDGANVRVEQFPRDFGMGVRVERFRLGGRVMADLDPGRFFAVAGLCDGNVGHFGFGFQRLACRRLGGPFDRKGIHFWHLDVAQPPVREAHYRFLFLLGMIRHQHRFEYEILPLCVAQRFGELLEKVLVNGLGVSFPERGKCIRAQREVADACERVHVTLGRDGSDGEFDAVRRREGRETWW